VRRLSFSVRSRLSLSAPTLSSFPFSSSMSSPAVLTFAVIGEGDSPIFEADLSAPPSAAFTDAPAEGEDGDDDEDAAKKDPSSASASTSDHHPQPSSRDERAAYLHQFVLHAALDAVDEVLFSHSGGGGAGAGGGGGAEGGAAGSSGSSSAAGAGGAPHLGVVDRFNALQVSAYATPGSLKLLLLHDGRPDDVVRGFFKEVHEALVKARLNPFFVGGAGSSSSVGGGASSAPSSSFSSSLCCGGGSSGTGLAGLLSARGSGFDRRVRSLARSYFRVMV